MNGFTTANSVYYVDLANRRITCGKLGNKTMRFATGAMFMIGQPGVAYFVDDNDNPLYTNDGRWARIKTGTITGYI